MDENRNLLYDPMFEHKPDVRLENVPHAKQKKLIFIILIVFFVGLSLFLSFSSLGNDKYEYEETDSGMMFYSFSGQKDDTVLTIDYVTDENGVTDETKPVTSVRKFCLCCNEYVEYIFIGKDVEELENHCFYYCKNLKAVFVDPENENYVSVDGVLYSKDMTQIILCPMEHTEYLANIALGAKAPESQADIEAFSAALLENLGTDENLSDDETEARNKLVQENGGDFVIPDTVTEICDSAFSDCANLVTVAIPEGVKTIGQLAFFKCKSMSKCAIPDGVETLKSDAFSYCESLTYIFVPESVKTIGHHAFYGCMGVENIAMEADSLDGIETGESWLPKRDNRTLKTKDVVFSQERRAE